MSTFDAPWRALGLDSWKDLQGALFRPRRPRWQEAMARAGEFAQDTFARLQRRGHRLGSAASRRDLLALPGEVESLWESLAPVAWVGDPRRRFAGPSGSSPRAADQEDWKSLQSFPWRPEDVVALCADVQAVERVELLAMEASARAARLGCARIEGVRWWSVPRSYAHYFDAGPDLMVDCSQMVLDGVGPRPPDLASAMSALHQQVKPRGMIVRDRGRVNSIVFYALRMVEGYLAWQFAALRGDTIRRVTNLFRRGGILNPDAMGSRVEEFQNPFEPLVHALLEGYVIAALDPRGARVLFPRVPVKRS